MRSAQARFSCLGVFSMILHSSGISRVSLTALRTSYSVTPKNSATRARAEYFSWYSPEVPFSGPDFSWFSPEVVRIRSVRIPWRLFAPSNALYALPRSMTLSSCRWIRLVEVAITIARASSASTTSTGISVHPANLAALARLCPARISKLPLSIGRTMIRTIIPSSLSWSANAFNLDGG